MSIRLLEVQACEEATDLKSLMSCHDTSQLVYRLRTQILRFVAPMPEQVGTPTILFPVVSGGAYKIALWC